MIPKIFSLFPTLADYNLSADATGTYESKEQIYPINLKNQIFGFEKAPWLDDRK